MHVSEGVHGRDVVGFLALQQKGQNKSYIIDNNLQSIRNRTIQTKICATIQTGFSEDLRTDSCLKTQQGKK